MKLEYSNLRFQSGLILFLYMNKSTSVLLFECVLLCSSFQNPLFNNWFTIRFFEKKSVYVLENIAISQAFEIYGHFC